MSHPLFESKNFPVCTGQIWSGNSQSSLLHSVSPIDGKALGTVGQATPEEYEQVMQTALTAFTQWRQVPAPRRGEIVRQIGEEFRKNKHALGDLVSTETGKSRQEGWGEVQEIIDICDFAVGLSRQINGMTMPSERPHHRLMEQWHPLGAVGIISAFNFPVAVWSWNAMLAAVCGDVSIWKPSEKTPLTAVACFKLMSEVFKRNEVPEGVFNLIIDGVATGQRMAADHRLPLISATGSTRMGRAVAQTVAARLGKSLLELGGNNAIILTENTDLNLAIPTVVFGAVGTAGQRCTTTRRLIIHESIYDKVVAGLQRAYTCLKIGNPLEEIHHMGPLIDREAVDTMMNALNLAREQGGKIVFGGEVLTGTGYESGCYVQPAIVQAHNDMPIVQEETFAPILYLIKYAGPVTAAIEIQNNVRQGLSSSIFSENMQQVEEFLSAWGSDCGIANVNLGTSGAEIGGAFGGEKETGGGRESGSDSWKAYMRRQTTTVNYGKGLPLAQGIRFSIE